MGNEEYLIPNIDPLGIGRTVKISYPSYKDENNTAYKSYIHDYAKAHGDYTQEKFEADLRRYEEEYMPTTGALNVLPAMSRVVENLWESNTTRFLDNEGNVMLYKKEGLDSVYDNNFNMQDYIQENTEARYHLVEANGTEAFMPIPRPKEETLDTQEPFNYAAKIDDILHQAVPHIYRNMEENHTREPTQPQEEETNTFSPQVQEYLDQFAPQSAQGYENNYSYDDSMEL